MEQTYACPNILATKLRRLFFVECHFKH